MAKIGVEDTLDEIMQSLKNKGHEVVALDQNNASECDLCVVSGKNEQLLGIPQRANMAAVINVDGMTADEALHAIERNV